MIRWTLWWGAGTGVVLAGLADLPDHFTHEKKPGTQPERVETHVDLRILTAQQMLSVTMSEIIAGKVMSEYLDLIIKHPSAMKYSIKTSIVRWTVWILPAVAMLFTACQNESRGFVLPEGDAAHGKVLFSELNCTRCHSIGDIAWTGSARYDDVHVKLGGEVTHLKTYGELVTSVINPSHKISQQDTSHQKLTLIEGMSKMELPRYNELMTVQELVDIVAFLQSEYKLVVPDVTYPYHGF